MSIQDIINKKVRLFIYATGAGAGAQNKIWQVPGCSSVLVGAGFPYDNETTSKIIGYTPLKFVSQETSIELAMAAYMEAFNPNVKDVETIGIGLTASVASTREHRGDHQIYVTAISNNKSITLHHTLLKGLGVEFRLQDGSIADNMIIAAIESILDMKDPQSTYAETDTTIAVKEQILARPLFKNDGSKCTSKVFFDEASDYTGYIFYPGSFNPLHEGHLFGAKQAYKAAVHLETNEMEVKDIIFTTCVNPKHKAEPTAAELLQRIKQMRGYNFLLTLDDPYYVDKAKMFPGSMIAMGADVLLSLFDPKWGIDPIEMLNVFSDNNIRFLVQGRVVNDQFYTLRNIRELVKLTKEDGKTYYPLQDNKYYRCFAHVTGRTDISSTALRNKNQ